MKRKIKFFMSKSDIIFCILRRGGSILPYESKPYSLRGQINLGGQNMDNDKKKKIIAFVITALISLIISVAATLLGVEPDALREMIPDCGADIAVIESL